MQFYRYIGLILVFKWPFGLVAQQDSLLSYSSDTVILYSSALDKKIRDGKKISIEDNQIFHLENSSVQIQSNGPGSLTTPLLHGMGARHTAILWKGVNLQSPVNGTMDLTLISFQKEVTINATSVSSLVGTNGLAGSLSLESFEQNRISAQWNNMGNIQLSVGKGIKSYNYDFHLNVSLLRNANEFNYLDQGTMYIQQNAEIKGIDIESNNKWWISNNVKLEGHIWYQQYKRLIPSSKSAIYNDATQDDQNFRSQIGLILNRGYLKYSLLSEGITYQDAAVYSDARSLSSIVNAEYDFQLFQGGLLFRNDQVNASFFQEDQSRNTLSVQLSRSIQPFSRWQIGMNLRSESYSGFQSPLLYLLDTKYQLHKNLHWKLSFDRSYNIPAFNDLFWPTGGNPELSPEKSYGLISTMVYEKNETSFGLSFFSKNVSDWIIWSPVNTFWTPTNQRKVWSRGLDSYVNYTWNWNGVKFLTSANYHFTVATIQEDERFDSFEGNQLIYVPRHRWGGQIFLKKAKIRGGVNIKGIGKRYTAFDNLESVGAFQTIDLKVSFKYNRDFEISFSVNNLLNEDYERVAFFAMPLRNVSLRINYLIH